METVSSEENGLLSYYDYLRSWSHLSLFEPQGYVAKLVF